MGTRKSGNRCETCQYYEALTTTDWGCFYILYAKKQRGCNPEQCDKWKKRQKKDAVQLRLNLMLGERGML